MNFAAPQKRRRRSSAGALSSFGGDSHHAGAHAGGGRAERYIRQKSAPGSALRARRGPSCSVLSSAVSGMMAASIPDPHHAPPKALASSTISKRCCRSEACIPARSARTRRAPKVKRPPVHFAVILGLAVYGRSGHRGIRLSFSTHLRADLFCRVGLRRRKRMGVGDVGRRAHSFRWARQRSRGRRSGRLERPIFAATMERIQERTRNGWKNPARPELIAELARARRSVTANTRELRHDMNVTGAAASRAVWRATSGSG